LLDGITDEEIEHYLAIVDEHLNYIKNGSDENE